MICKHSFSPCTLHAAKGMNQHFIYNTLNQVQYFIQKGDKEASLNYISRLSRLLRQWMHGTEQTSISLADEISLLQGYLSLEQLRFSHRFSFDVVTDVQESRSVFVTPHLIFPLVEHAVSWSMRQTESGHISIRVVPDSPFLQCRVVAETVSAASVANLHLLTHEINFARACNVSL